MSRPDITVAIPTYNREADLTNIINEILNQSHANLELLILDQTKKHRAETINFLKGIKDVRFNYISVAPRSLMAARNLALSLAKAPIILFLDDDIKTTKDLVKQHLQSFKKQADVSAVGGRVTQDGFPSDGPILKFDKYSVSHGVFSSKSSGYTNAFPGGNHSIKVVDALECGGYDTRYYRIAFREENDMSMKLVKSGKKIYYNSKAEVLHLNTPTGGHTHYTDLFDSVDFYRNELFFTMRSVKVRDLPRALYIKFMTYCHIQPLSKGLKRSIYFLIGLLTALRRLFFGRQIAAREITK